MIGPPAVVVGGEISATAVTRSLARTGVEVHVLGPVLEHSGLRRSRYPASYTRFMNKHTIQSDWLAWLEQGRSGAVLLPCDDDALELIARNRPRLEELGYRPFEVNDEAALAMLDKARIYDLARAAGVAAPVVVRLHDETDLEEAIGRLRFPWALKPLHSHLFGRHYSGKAVVVHDEDELRREWRPMKALGLKMLATEIVDPASEECSGYLTYLDADGEPLVEFTKRKVRQHPIRFGIGSYHVSGWDPEIAEIGLRFFRAVGVRGLAYVEFKRDRDGIPKVLDVNHRFLDSTEVVRLSGLDIARFTYRRLAGLPDDQEASGFADDVRLWFAFADTQAFIERRRRGEAEFGDWVGSLAGRQHFPIFTWEDPIPGIVDAAWLGRRAARKAVRRLRGKARP